MFKGFTFNFNGCLFIIFFMMLLKQLSNMKKIVLKRRGYKKNPQLSGRLLLEDGGSKKFKGRGLLKGDGGVFRGRV